MNGDDILELPGDLKIDRAVLQNFSINQLELLAVAVAVAKWSHRWRHHNVLLHLDNSSAKTWLCKGSLPSVLVGELHAYTRRWLRLIQLESLKFDVKLRIVQIASEQNIRADALSRRDMERFNLFQRQWTKSGIMPELTPVEINGSTAF